MRRGAGVLLHITSLPSSFGIGDVGPGARAFARFLHEAGIAVWQILPIGPTGYGDSPYQSFSAFAGNPILISPEGLVEMGLVEERELEYIANNNPRFADYGAATIFKHTLLRRAFENFREQRPPKAFEAFCREHAHWLEDYALFMALKAHFIHERSVQAKKGEAYLCYYSRAFGLLSYNEVQDAYFGAAWNTWPEAIRRREAGAVSEYARLLADEIRFVFFEQFIFHAQWQELHKFCSGLGISLMGDMPIFVSLDSSDVWANPALFAIDADAMPKAVAGVPPDYFSETGQLWGNPLYNWEACSQGLDLGGENYAWWVSRVRKALKDTDTLRIDHFRGFEAYWAVPFGEKTAINGVWKPGPGAAIFEAMRSALGRLPIVAEDLGIITPEVEALRLKLGFAGMRILQFAFDDNSGNSYLPHNYEPATVVYTGTHDNDTTLGWYCAAPETTRDRVRLYMNVSGEDISWDMVRLAFSSVAQLAIVPMQDLLSLDSAHRMNIPGQAEANWRYRATYEDLSREVAMRLRRLGEMFNRLAN